MILQSLLEDKRTEWQKKTQEEILGCLICKTHKYKDLEKNEDRLVMVFGKSHAGKTTFILTLLGIDEKKIDEVNKILRAGVPEGQSSTSTAIIYQKSDDDYFGISEGGINGIKEDGKLTHCNQKEFSEKIAKIRDDVEVGKRNNDNIIYLFLPKKYFVGKKWMRGNISILDVPGYETSNEKERYHTNAILSKYMSISALNIIVRSINDINDLRYFMAPNRDDATKLISDKYIIVTTRSYSAANVFEYFLKEKETRKGTFGQFLEAECRKQFEIIFGEKIPKVFPLDLGQSFHVMINNKLKDPDDRKEVISYRESVLKNIYEDIYSKQTNSLVSWIREVISDEDYYGSCEKRNIDDAISKVEKDLADNNECSLRTNDRLKRLKGNYEQICADLNDYEDKLKKCTCLSTDDVDTKVKETLKLYFTDNYKWRVSRIERSTPAIFARLFNDITEKICEDYEEKSDYYLSEYDKIRISGMIEEGEYYIKDYLDKTIDKHKILKALNPSNKEKVTIGEQLLQERVSTYSRNVINLISNNIKIEREKKREKKREMNILITENNLKLEEYKNIMSRLKGKMAELNSSKREVERRIDKDKQILNEYRIISRRCYCEQRDEIMDCINKGITPEDKLEYLLFLGIIANDYKKIMME